MPDLDPSVRDLLALTLVPGLGPQRIGALLERFGSASAALRAGLAEVGEVAGVGPGLASALREAARSGAAEAELERAARAGVLLLARGGPGYPPHLAETPSAPVLLYVRGAITAAD